MSSPYVPPVSIALSPKARALAMDPEALRRAAAESLAVARPQMATILAFRPDLPTRLDQVAELYLRTPQAPTGLAKALAAQHGVDYGALLTRIGVLRQQHRFG